MSFSTANVQREYNMATSYIFDGVQLRRPTQAEYTGSWVHLVEQHGTTPLTLASIATNPILSGCFIDQPSLDAWLNAPAKGGAYGGTAPQTAPSSAPRAGQLYLPLGQWVIDLEVRCSGAPNRFAGLRRYTRPAGTEDTIPTERCFNATEFLHACGLKYI
eukprot:5971441-Amphidinium_carterae.1